MQQYIGQNRELLADEETVLGTDSGRGGTQEEHTAGEGDSENIPERTEVSVLIGIMVRLAAVGGMSSGISSGMQFAAAARK